MRERMHDLDANRILIRYDHGIPGMIFGGVVVLAAVHVLSGVLGINPWMDASDLSGKALRGLFAFSLLLFLFGLVHCAFQVRVLLDRETRSVSQVILLHPWMVLRRRHVRLDETSTFVLEADPGDHDIPGRWKIHLESGAGDRPVRFRVSTGYNVRDAARRLDRMRSFLQVR